MRIIRRVVVMLAVCGMQLGAQDQAASKPKAAKPAGDKAAMSMPMPKPSPEMVKLTKMLSGNWTVAEKHEANPMMPNGGTGTGTAKIWPGPGGLSLMENYHSSGAMGNFNGVGTWWYDSKAQLFHGLWCDNMTPEGCDAAGTSKFDGDKLVGNMEGKDEKGQKVYMRFIYSDFKPESFVMTMEMGADTSKMQKAMTLTYTKAAGGKM